MQNSDINEDEYMYGYPNEVDNVVADFFDFPLYRGCEVSFGHYDEGNGNFFEPTTTPMLRETRLHQQQKDIVVVISDVEEETIDLLDSYCDVDFPPVLGRYPLVHTHFESLLTLSCASSIIRKQLESMDGVLVTESGCQVFTLDVADAGDCLRMRVNLYHKNSEVTVVEGVRMSGSSTLFSKVYRMIKNLCLGNSPMVSLQSESKSLWSDINSDSKVSVNDVYTNDPAMLEPLKNWLSDNPEESILMMIFLAEENPSLQTEVISLVVKELGESRLKEMMVQTLALVRFLSGSHCGLSKRDVSSALRAVEGKVSLMVSSYTIVPQFLQLVAREELMIY